MTQRNDQIFQLSLTEIAFTISFILLLLLGFLIARSQAEQREAEEALANTEKQHQAAQAEYEALDQTLRAVQKTLTDTGMTNPDELITRLVEAEKAAAERERLKQRVEDLDQQLTALAEIKQLLEAGQGQGSASKETIQKGVEAALALQADVRDAFAKDQVHAAGDGPTRQELRQSITAAAALERELDSQLGASLVPGEEAAMIADLVRKAKEGGALETSAQAATKEASDLRGQVAFLRNRLEARGGRDYPPCWADENGKVEFLLNVELKPDVVEATPGWPPARESDALVLPGMAEVLAEPAALETFENRVQGIFDWSRQQDPECRHYVRIRSSIPDAVQSDRTRLAVERYFYKVEVRR